MPIKQIMKKLFPLFLFGIFGIFSLSAKEKPVVASTASMIWDMAKNIGGDHFQYEVIVPVGGDPHLYEPVPSDARLVASADLILKNGLTFEGWLNTLIENAGTKATVVQVTDGVPALTSLTYKDAADPHAWMDVSYAQFYIKNIKDALIRLAPEHQADIEANYEKYRQALLELDDYILKAIKKIPEAQRILITSHDAFQYYGRRYGLQLQAIQGVSTDTEAQTDDVMRVSKVIRQSGVPAVFVESTINPKMLKRIAKDNGVVVGGSLFSDSIGGEKSEAPSYIDMLRYNTNTIVNALTQPKGKVANDTAIEEKTPEDNVNMIMIGVLAAVFIGGLVFMIRKMSH